jgi:hypothetical protein
MDELMTALAKIFGVALGFFGISRVVQAPLAKRIKTLEDAPPKREAAECRQMQAACPVAVRLASVEKQNDGLTAWMIRIENKLDRLVSREGQ